MLSYCSLVIGNVCFRSEDELKVWKMVIECCLYNSVQQFYFLFVYISTNKSELLKIIYFYSPSFLKGFNGKCTLKVHNKVVSDAENVCEEFIKYFQSAYQPNIISRNDLNTNEDFITDNIGIPHNN